MQTVFLDFPDKLAVACSSFAMFLSSGYRDLTLRPFFQVVGWRGAAFQSAMKILLATETDSIRASLQICQPERIGAPSRLVSPATPYLVTATDVLSP